MTAPLIYAEPRDGTNRTPAASGTTSEKTVYGSPVQVVYGTAPVRAVPLLSLNRTSGTIKMDGVTGISAPVALMEFGLAVGPVDAIEGVVYEDRVYGPDAITSYQVDWDYLGCVDAPGYPPSFTLGNVSTAAVWSVLSSYDWDYKVPYGHLALMRCEKFALPNGASSLGEVKGVVRGFRALTRNTAREDALDNVWEIYDANPADVIIDLLENTRYGLGFPAGTVETDVGADGLSASSFRNYCLANGFLIAVGVDSAAQVADMVAQILQATNSVAFWEGDTFKVIPLGTEALTANGVTFTPVLQALEIDDDHILRDGGEPVIIRRTPRSEVYNVVPVEWSKDTLIRDAVLTISEDMSAAQATTSGVKRADKVSLPCIRTEAHALAISRLIAERTIYNRATFELVLNPRAAATVQVGDLLSLVHVVMGIDGQLLRVTSTDEDARGQVTVKAVEWHTSATITINSLPKVEDGA